MKKFILFILIIFQFTNCSNKEHDASYESEYDYTQGELYTEGSNIDSEQSIIHTQNKFQTHNGYSFPKNEIRYEFYWNGSNYYPIGWSRDGNIAFRKFTAFDGIGGCLDEIIIQSMITDKILKTVKLDEFSPEYSDDWNNHCDLEQTWRRERRTVLKYLNRYEIEDNSFGRLNKSKEITSRNENYTIKLSKEIRRRYEFNDVNQLQYRLKVYYSGESKTISKDIISAHNIDYLGYYKSPFEDRVVIVLQFQDAQEGEYSHNGGIITVGCDLHPRSWD